jgi:hypothetical protein
MPVGTPSMPPEPAALNYDVAISFLSGDVAVAKAIADRLEGSYVYFLLAQTRGACGNEWS